MQTIHDAIAAKAEEFKDVVKIGRTHLQDATPLTVGQEMSGWASLIERDIDRLQMALPGIARTRNWRHRGGHRASTRIRSLANARRRRSPN